MSALNLWGAQGFDLLITITRFKIERVWPFKTRILEFSNASRLAVAAARGFAFVEGLRSANAMHLFKGIIHSGDPTVGKLSERLGLAFEDEVKALNERSKLPNFETSTASVIFLDEVKKIVARANRYAIRKRRKEVGVTDVLRGLLEEWPDNVEHALLNRNLSLEQVKDLLENAERP